MHILNTVPWHHMAKHPPAVRTYNQTRYEQRLDALEQTNDQYYRHHAHQ